jgi:hypothetical protein
MLTTLSSSFALRLRIFGSSATSSWSLSERRALLQPGQIPAGADQMFRASGVHGYKYLPVLGGFLPTQIFGRAAVSYQAPKVSLAAADRSCCGPVVGVEGQLDESGRTPRPQQVHTLCNPGLPVDCNGDSALGS